MAQFETTSMLLDGIVLEQEHDLAMLNAQHSVLAAAVEALKEIALRCGVDRCPDMELQDFAAEQRVDLDDMLACTTANKGNEMFCTFLSEVSLDVAKISRWAWGISTAVAVMPTLCECWVNPALQLGCFVFVHDCVRRFGASLLARPDCRRSLRTLLALLENVADESTFVFHDQLVLIASHIKASLS